MKLDRACTIMTVKAVDEDKRIITGIASTPSPDRDGDIMDPDGAKFGSENPFLWQHDRTQPIGNCSAKKVKEGLQITAQLVKPTPDMPSQLVARLEEAWASIKSGLVKGLSIGFKPIKYAYLDSGGIHFLEWELLEVSAVTIPANAECSIQTVKSFDRQLLAALGTEKPVVKTINSAGASAPNKSSQKGKSTMNIAEQIKSFENKRAALASSLNDIMSKAADEGRTLDAEETESYDNTSTEIKAVDEHLKRLRDMETSMASTAKPVTKAASGEVTVVNNAPSIIRVEPKLEKGIAFARFAKSLAAGNGTDFIDPAKAAVADVSPASITNGITAIPSTGDPDTDAAAAFGKFITNNLQPNGAVWLMSSTTALTLSMRKNALGQKEYPDMTMLGGTFQGLPVIVSQYVGNQLVLVNAPDVYLADDGGVAVDMSREASLEMQSAPTHDSTTPTAVELVSMFQTNSVAIRAERWINWKRRRDTAVAVISGVDYSTGATS
ncbi:HK97 family phage prohead protease [Escherichia coli]|nr:HK97 family phage prohead protease [Escherichia coli]MCN9086589.1 HK97 family phage prohead protease [Escherichia coli]MCO0042812.1 HK97 family phage prohead protease [Escherichia coli]